MQPMRWLHIHTPKRRNFFSFWAHGGGEFHYIMSSQFMPCHYLRPKYVMNGEENRNSTQPTRKWNRQFFFSFGGGGRVGAGCCCCWMFVAPNVFPSSSQHVP